MTGTPRATTVRELMASARARLAEAGVDGAEAGLDAEVLAREALGWDRARLLAHADDPVPGGARGRFEGLVARRAAREPVSLLLGRREFWGFDFEVTPGVLTPRPETEIVVEQVLGLVKGSSRTSGACAPLRIADAGTGCGCLAVTLALALPDARVVATDLSAAALTVATRNARRHLVEARVRFVRASLLEGIGGSVDLVVSNPPYVPTGQIDTLAPEVRNHEPRLALDGGRDGLTVIRALLAQAEEKLAPGGWLVFEIGAGQDRAVASAVRDRPGLGLHHISADLRGIPRTVVARRAGDPSARG